MRSFEAVIRRIIDSGSPIEHVAILDGGLLGPAGDAYQVTADVIQVTYTYNAAGKVLVNKAPDGHPHPTARTR